jgi:gentisate 1,2-dioxygenase
MSRLPDWIGNYPMAPDHKEPVVMNRSQAKQFIYPDKPEHSDFNWAFVSTDRAFVAMYQLNPGVCFKPADVHAGDEVYYVLEGTLTMLNPETGHVSEINPNEGYLIPEGGWHQGYNFTNKKVRIFLIIAPKIWPPQGLPEEGFPGKTKFFSFGPQAKPDQKPVLDKIQIESKNVDMIGRWPIEGVKSRKKPVSNIHITENEKLPVIWGEDNPVLMKFLVSNDRVHMAEIHMPCGGLSPRFSDSHQHDGDEAIYVHTGALSVFLPETKEAFEVKQEEVMFIPKGILHQYINYSDEVMKAIKTIAPDL